MTVRARKRLEAPAEAAVPGAFLPVLVGIATPGRSRYAPKLHPPGCPGAGLCWSPGVVFLELGEMRMD